jgi:hypothetical protein
MRNLFEFFAGLTSRVMRAGAVALTLYMLAKSLFVVLFNRFNRNAYAAE